MKGKQRIILVLTVVLFSLSAGMCFAGGQQEEEPAAPPAPPAERPEPAEDLPDPDEGMSMLMRLQFLAMNPDVDEDVVLSSGQAKKIIPVLKDIRDEIQDDSEADISVYVTKISKVLTPEQNAFNVQMQRPAPVKGEKPDEKTDERPAGRPGMPDPTELISQLIDGLERL